MSTNWESQFVYRPPQTDIKWFDHTFSFIPKEETFGVRFLTGSKILNDSFTVNLKDIVERLPYKFNKINYQTQEKEMFNETELNFIGDTANKDLPAVQHKIESVVNEMARLGKSLSDLKITESTLLCIKQAIDQRKERTAQNERCC